MRFLVGAWALFLLLSLAGAVGAQNVQDDPVWQALVRADKAVEQGQLHFTRRHLSTSKGAAATHVYSYAPTERFVDVPSGPMGRLRPLTQGFDGHDSWTQQPSGVMLGPKKWSPGIIGSHGGFVPRPCFPMGRGLSFLKNPTISRANGKITVSGGWNDGLKIVATVDPAANYLARTIAIFDSKGKPFAQWQTSGALAGNLIARSAIYSVFWPKAGKRVYDSYTITSANFAPLSAKVFEPKTSGVRVFDYRVNESHPAFYLDGIAPGLSRSQVLADTTEYAAQQQAIQTRAQWRQRLAIGALGLGALALLLGIAGGMAALWNRRKERADPLKPVRSKWGGRFLIAGALCAWGLVLGFYGAYIGWTPAKLLGGRTGDLRADQTKIAAKASFGTIATNDPRLKKALAANDLKGAAKQMMKPGAFVGVVSNVRQTQGGGKLSLDFAANRATAMRAILLPSAMSRFPDLQTLIGKKVYVSGTITPHENRGEIVLHAPSQILLVK